RQCLRLRPGPAATGTDGAPAAPGVRQAPPADPGAGKRPHLTAVIGGDFAEVLAAAQDGNELAFSRLWRDGNPALLRYLRVIAPESAGDAAAETWRYAVRGLARFRGDEQAWRARPATPARRRRAAQTRH